LGKYCTRFTEHSLAIIFYLKTSDCYLTDKTIYFSVYNLSKQFPKLPSTQITRSGQGTSEEKFIGLKKS
jgi:hypothetical protein